MANASVQTSDFSLEKNLTCSICMEIFSDPVTTPCGHSFCSKCLECSISVHHVNDMCPLCKKHLSKAPDVNIVLRDIAQQMKTTISNRSSGDAGEVVCDVCTEPRQKAKKSCLVCLASYCSDHLVNHSAERLKGHKLVEPLQNLDARACLIHGRSLELYSKTQQKSICVRCLEGSQEEVVSNEEAWLEKKTQLENTKRALEERIEIRKTKMEEINAALKESKKYPSVSVHDDMKDWTDVKLDNTLSFGSMREISTTMLRDIQQELKKLDTIELKRLQKFSVDVELDAQTAHQRLIISPNGKEVKDGGEIQEVADSTERFDVFGSVLGLNSLTTGKSYWEVKVNNKTGWDLGVARGSAGRKGKLKLSPDHGYWVLVHYEEENYAAMMNPPIGLSLEEKPETVGVFVDYEENLLSFYDVTTQSHIYSFTDCLFKDEIFPYFSPHYKQDKMNSEALVVSNGTHSEMGEVWRSFCSICL
ncbi:E3 ubiquitin-protein ligase TRIM39-like isoform X2 [Cyprinodon tularosa]|uniref:E3 ubiquitin-protein ligase TRIM39-like isoform X2 n=1 Tax=Cyprinodon tularosa TaxID=77115 RepID=UPI0018E1DEF2|nr:E3 ubiquitin-protein ligase TRIM39-like isoform X2 [Cyprinodon tularosa]